MTNGSRFRSNVPDAPRSRAAAWLASCAAGAMTVMGTIGAITALCTPAQAQSYPSKPVRLVLGFAAGAGTDVIARIIGQRVAEQIGQSVVVDNKPGANGNLATDVVATAPADGYTVFYNTSAVVFNPLLEGKSALDALRQFAPVTLAANVPLVLIVRPNMTVNDVRSFVAMGKASGGKLNYASGGTGNITHLVAAYFLQHTGFDATHIPYKSANTAIGDVAGSRVDFYTYTLNGSLPFIKDGRVKALAVSSVKRAPTLPDVPTFAETVMPGFQAGSWSGVMVPARTPADIVSKLHAEFTVALRHPDVRAKLVNLDVDVIGSSPDEYATFLKNENELWRKVIRDANIKME